MALEQQIADAIIIAFDEMGGDPYDAARAALYRRTVQSWIRDETTKVALAGGAEMAIPGTQAITIPIGIAYLMRKMATLAWGIGALRGAIIVETPYHSDLRNILTLYANGNLYNSTLLDFQAISREAYEWAIRSEGYLPLRELTDSMTRIDTTANTWRVLRVLAEEFPADERAQRLLRTLSDSETVESLLSDAHGRVVTTRTSDDPVQRRIGAKLALKLAGQIGGRVPARIVMGFIPLAGALVNGFLNTQTLKGFSEAAEAYYNVQVRPQDIPTEA